MSKMVKPNGQPSLPAGQARATGPRTRRGKAISSRNALRHGFFAKEAVLDTPYYRENKREFYRLLRGLMDDWKPVGVSEVVQVELTALHLQQYRRLLRVQQALILERNTPKESSLEWVYNSTRRRLLAEREGKGEAESQVCTPTFEDLVHERTEQDYKELFERADRLSAEHARIAKLESALPCSHHLEWLQKCEGHILRSYYRALAELERLQRMRLGEGVPPRLVLEVNSN